MYKQNKSGIKACECRVSFYFKHIIFFIINYKVENIYKTKVHLNRLPADIIIFLFVVLLNLDQLKGDIMRLMYYGKCQIQRERDNRLLFTHRQLTLTKSTGHQVITQCNNTREEECTILSVIKSHLPRSPFFVYLYRYYQEKMFRGFS